MCMMLWARWTRCANHFYGSKCKLHMVFMIIMMQNNRFLVSIFAFLFPGCVYQTMQQNSLDIQALVTVYCLCLMCSAIQPAYRS